MLYIMALNIQLGDTLNGNNKTFKAFLTNADANYKLIGRNSSDYLTNKIITDPTNVVTATSLLINGSPLKINNLGTVGQVLTMNNDGTASFSNVSGTYATLADINLAILAHSNVNTTHGTSSKIVGISDSEILTQKTINSVNNNILINGTAIGNIISESNVLLVNSTPQFAKLGLNKPNTLATLDILGNYSDDSEYRCVRCESANPKITMKSIYGKEYDIISRDDGSFAINSKTDASNRLYIDTNGNLFINSQRQSSNYDNGSIVTEGGIGVRGNSYFNSKVVIQSSGFLEILNIENSTSPTTGSIRISGGMYTGGSNCFNAGYISYGTCIVSNLTESTNINNGALSVFGGLGVVGNFNCGKNISIGGNLSTSGSVSIGGTTTIGGVLTINNDLSVNNINCQNIASETIVNNGILTINSIADASGYYSSISTRGGLYVDKSIVVNDTIYYNKLKSFSLAPTVIPFNNSYVYINLLSGSSSNKGEIQMNVSTTFNISGSNFKICDIVNSIDMVDFVVIMMPSNNNSVGIKLYINKVNNTTWSIYTTSIFNVNIYKWYYIIYN